MIQHEFSNTEGQPKLSPEDARAGETTGRVRIILGVSFALAVIGLGIAMLSFASGI